MTFRSWTEMVTVDTSGSPRKDLKGEGAEQGRQLGRNSVIVFSYFTFFCSSFLRPSQVLVTLYGTKLEIIETLVPTSHVFVLY
jgi:hypothetical protein